MVVACKNEAPGASFPTYLRVTARSHRQDGEDELANLILQQADLPCEGLRGSVEQRGAQPHGTAPSLADGGGVKALILTLLSHGGFPQAIVAAFSLDASTVAAQPTRQASTASGRIRAWAKGVP